MWVLIMCRKPLLLVVYCMTCDKFQGSLNQSFARTLRRMEGASKGAYCLDREKSFYYSWESLWQALADDLHQEMVSQSFKV